MNTLKLLQRIWHLIILATMKKNSTFILILLFTSSLFGQIRFLEVDPTGDRITIKNFGGSTVNISAYRLCARLTYTANLTSVNLESGDLNLVAGETVVLSGWPLTDVSSDLGIYLPFTGTALFGSSSQMVDFTQWGAAGIGRESVERCFFE